MARPGGAVGVSGPYVSGVLRKIETAPLASGMPGYKLTLGPLGKDVGHVYGPLAGHNEIEVKHLWRQRAAIEPSFEPEPPFPRSVKCVRVLFLGGPFDGQMEDISVEDFYSTRIYRKDPGNADVSVTYETFEGVSQIKGALWGGKWRMVESIDRSKPIGEMVTRYQWKNPAASIGK
jgi:hypothetical protein